MSEKTLLVEIEKEKRVIVEQKLAVQREEAHKQKEKEFEEREGKKYSNAFSSNSFKGVKQPDLIGQKRNKHIEKEVSDEHEIAKVESKGSSIIEKPNYDYIETLSEQQREKVFKIERQEKEKAKAKPSRLKAIVLSILFALFGVWGVVNITQIDNIGAQIAEVASEYYNINLPKYLKNLVSLDATSSDNMENLFETIPDEDVSPSEIIEQSNWFDRFCNFIAGLFGG